MPPNPTPPVSPPELVLGVKSDPIEYRYSFPWLFRIMQEQGIHCLQLGSFFEMYQLPDAWFLRLRETAAAYDIRITSVFTAHRELGGLFQNDPEWHDVARRNLRRLVEIAALVGAECAGHNAGAVLRDQGESRRDGIRRHLEFMKELLLFAGERGVQCLTLEPMSCSAEPPTLPQEIQRLGSTLSRWRQEHPNAAEFGFCSDVSHGYADVSQVVRHPPLELLEATLPWLRELHLKNTDSRFEHTFGFSPSERLRGIVDIPAIRQFLAAHSETLPRVPRLIGYLELSGPKLGRDYSDPRLEQNLVQSIAYLKTAWTRHEVPAGQGLAGTPPALLHPPRPGDRRSRPDRKRLPPRGTVWCTASLMCADLRCAEQTVHELENTGAQMVHFDIMDGRFTPNLPLGFELMRQLREASPLPFDVHLMTETPELFVEKSLEAGADLIAVHAESSRHLDRLLAQVHAGGAAAGIALNPATPLDVLEYVLGRISFVLIMTVNPGFAGQRLVPGGIRKIAACRRFLEEHDAGDIRIQVDGNVSFGNIPGMVRAGADILVLGSSSLFSRSGSLEENWEKIQGAIAAARSGASDSRDTEGGASTPPRAP